jgi:hypothetical protein
MMGRRADRLARAVPLPSQDLVQHRAPARDRLTVLRRRESRLDLVRLAHPQPRAGDLRRFVIGQVQPPHQLTRLQRQLGQRRPVLAPSLDGRCDRGPGRSASTVRVEEVALPALVEESLLVMLAVDLHERSGHLRDPGGRHWVVIEASRGAPGDAHLAHHDEWLR